MKRANIKLCITDYICQLDFIVSWVQPSLEYPPETHVSRGGFSKISRRRVTRTAPVSPPASQGVHSPHRRGVDRTPKSDGTSEGVTSAVTGTGQNVGTFVASAEDIDDDCPDGQSKNIQKLRFDEPSRRPTVEGEPPESQPVESSEPPHIKRLDGRITRMGELAFAGGTYCEVWVGRWDKGGEEAGREKGGAEKVSLSFAVSILLKTAFHRWP